MVKARFEQLEGRKQQANARPTAQSGLYSNWKVKNYYYYFAGVMLPRPRRSNKKAPRRNGGLLVFACCIQPAAQILTLRNRRALEITDTEEKLIAAAAKIGEISRPVNGNRMPAATGTPAVL